MICPSHVLPLNEPWSYSRRPSLSVESFGTFQDSAADASSALYRWLLQFARRCTQSQMLEAGRRLLPILESSIRRISRTIRRAPRSRTVEGERSRLRLSRRASIFEAFAQTDQLLSETYGISARRIEGAELSVFDPSLRPELGGRLRLRFTTVRSDPTSWFASGASICRETASSWWRVAASTPVPKSGGSIESLQTSNGEMQADHFVFALGAWSSKWSAALGLPAPGRAWQGLFRHHEPAGDLPSAPHVVPRTAHRRDTVRRRVSGSAR